MMPTAEAEMEMRQTGKYFTENPRKTRQGPPTDTLIVSKSDAELIRTLLQDPKQAKDQECQREKEALQAWE